MITFHQQADRLTLNLAAHAVSPFDAAFRRELTAAVERIEAAPPLQVVLAIDGGAASADHAGHAGHDGELDQLLALTPAQAADCMRTLADYNALLRRLDLLDKPLTATLSGAVEGHALGLALACHHRIALADASLALPQVHLGLAPVAGGLARAVRLSGLQAAMPLLIEGKTLSAAQALEAGLLHDVVADADALAGALTKQLAALPADGAAAGQPWDAKGYRPPGGALNSPALQTLLQVAPAMLRQRSRGHYPAPEAILCAMVEGLQVDFDNALLIESRYFCQCALGVVAKNLIRLGRIPAAPSARAEQFAATLRLAYLDELAQLRAEGLPAALLRHAAMAAGLAQLPPEEAAAPSGAAGATATDVVRARDRLLYAQALAALRGVDALLAGDHAQADRISVRDCGFPAHTGGALRFIATLGASQFAARAAQLGARFAPPPEWRELAE
ncbi:enoyl-CoA hydratase-related protein [Rugamonas sp. CCM 8940]|uniref:enoyl-CoA hydratase-related protein n=1 Tax=Rugamonas sp. CCM 8940 TaxID=2765359 RepID=UPI0018F69608|nr:enoyl-CoA hydratase-related protein [Rugamonas sp. CCM 8940]MBJ7311184.1 enoyl-CoA hydratase/isomerase family protein [Rugamonas sp. CCM 8940]